MFLKELLSHVFTLFLAQKFLHPCLLPAPALIRAPNEIKKAILLLLSLPLISLGPEICFFKLGRFNAARVQNRFKVYLSARIHHSPRALHLVYQFLGF